MTGLPAPGRGPDMPRPSSVEQLPPQILAEVQELIRNRVSIDAIVNHLRTLGEDVSRSSVGRYSKKYSDQLSRFQEAQNVAGVWVQKLSDNSTGDVGQLIAEMLKTLAFEHLASIGDGKDGTDPERLMLLGRMAKDIASADKMRTDLALKIRQQLAKEAAETAEEVGKAEGLSAATVDKIKAAVLGIAQ